MKRLTTKNQALKGQKLNGVPYEEKTFVLYGVEVTGVFPVFNGIKVVLDGTVDSIYKELGDKDDKFYYGTMQLATRKLKQELSKHPALKQRFTPNQLDDINAEKGQIAGYTWHHYEELAGESPIMELVDEQLHKACVHTGGSYTWNKKHIL